MARQWRTVGKVDPCFGDRPEEKEDERVDHDMPKQNVADDLGRVWCAECGECVVAGLCFALSCRVVSMRQGLLT